MQTLIGLLLVLLSSSTPLPEEDTTAKILYKTEFLMPEGMWAELKTSDPQRYREFMAFARKTAEEVAQLEYELIFNSSSSRFEARETMSKDSDRLGSLQETTGVYYNNIEEGERLQQLEQQGRTFLIEREPLQWKITSETREIAGFNCRKATSSQDFYSHRSRKNIVQEIEAWFAPAIPASFGPKGYGGLPGLILDITVAQEHIYVSDIDLDHQSIKVERPVKGKKVSFIEFQAISAGLGEKFREFNGIDE